MLQAVLKFSTAVVHVSSMSTVDEMDATAATCCLGDGQVVAFSISNIVKKYVWHSRLSLQE